MSAVFLQDPARLTPPDAAALSATAAAASRGRASWSGLLKLSLVAVPVKAYPATVSGHDTHFNQLHADCGQRIRYEKHCSIHGKVEAGAIVSGYPYAPDQYVVVDEADLDKLRPAQDRALTLERFFDAGHLDPALFSGRSLHLLPDGPAAQHPYAVLTQTLDQRAKWALGRLILSHHRHLALVRPVGRVLTLHLLHYPTQVRPSTPLETQLRPEIVNADELKLAGMLIDASSQPIPWSEYRDDTAEKLAALVEATLQGRPPVAPVPEPGQVLQLLDALKQSVAQAVGQSSSPAAVSSSERPGKKKSTRRAS